MKLAFPLALFALLPLQSFAETSLPTRAIYDVKQTDWNGDGKLDSVYLSYTNTDALVSSIVLSQPNGREALAVYNDKLVYVPGQGSGGSLELSINARGSIVLKSDSGVGFGRTVSTATYTIAFRDGGFKLAGFTHTEFDRLTLKSMKCDLNLLTKKGEVEWEGELESGKKQVRITSQTPALSDLDATYFPSECSGYPTAD